MLKWAERSTVNIVKHNGSDWSTGDGDAKKKIFHKKVGWYSGEERESF